MTAEPELFTGEYAELKEAPSDRDLWERIAIALEQLTLAYIDAHPLQAQTVRPPAPSPIPAMQVPQGGPVGPNPPPVAPYVVAPPAGPPAGTYQNPAYFEGSIHAPGHKPLKSGRGGLYCPSKLPDGNWCTFRVAP